MKIFKISEDGFRTMKKKMLSRIIPMMIGAVIIGGGISMVNSKEKIPDLSIVLVVIAFMTLTVMRGIYAAVKKQKELCGSYTLTITDNLITREQVNTPAVSIYFNDIRQIARTRNGSFVIKGRDPQDLIIIPAQIDDHSGLEAILNGIQPVNEKVKDSFDQRYQLLLALLGIGTMICVYTINNKIVVGIAGTFFVVLMIWSMVKIFKSKNVDHKTKRSFLWILVVLASVIYVMIMKLSGDFSAKAKADRQQSARENKLTNDFQYGQLTAGEKIMCDTLEIDTMIVISLREYNANKIEPFHYSLANLLTKDGQIEAEPRYLKGLVITESGDKSYDLVFALKDEFRAKGYSIFIVEDNLASPKGSANIAVLKTTDKYSILKQVGTDGINYDITNDSLLSIIRRFDKEYDLELIAASGDWCEFIIHKEPVNWKKFASDAYKACPDLVDQGTGTVDVLADEMKRTRRLYFWWD